MKSFKVCCKQNSKNNWFYWWQRGGLSFAIFATSYVNIARIKQLSMVNALIFAYFGYK